jgi:hypothetical protein
VPQSETEHPSHSAERKTARFKLPLFAVRRGTAAPKMAQKERLLIKLGEMLMRIVMRIPYSCGTPQRAVSSDGGG